MCGLLSVFPHHQAFDHKLRGHVHKVIHRPCGGARASKNQALGAGLASVALTIDGKCRVLVVGLSGLTGRRRGGREAISGVRGHCSPGMEQSESRERHHAMASGADTACQKCTDKGKPSEECSKDSVIPIHTRSIVVRGPRAPTPCMFQVWCAKLLIHMEMLHLLKTEAI